MLPMASRKVRNTGKLKGQIAPTTRATPPSILACVSKQSEVTNHRWTPLYTDKPCDSIHRKKICVHLCPSVVEKLSPPAARCPPNANSKRKHKPQINTHKSCDSIPRKTSVFIRVHPWLKNSAHPPDASHQTRILSESTNHRSTRINHATPSIAKSSLSIRG